VKTPREARTFDEIYELPEDNWSGKTHWLMIDQGFVSIVEQRMGEQSTAKIEIPRRTFDAMIDWYNGTKAKE